MFKSTESGMSDNEVLTSAYLMPAKQGSSHSMLGIQLCGSSIDIKFEYPNNQMTDGCLEFEVSMCV